MAVDWTIESVSGEPETYFVHQPTLEATLDSAVRVQPSIKQYLGYEAVAVRQFQGHVEVDLREPHSGVTRSLSSRYLIGVDGAKSMVREAIGGGQKDLGFAADWLVVDVLPNDGVKLDIPGAAQLCDPARPTMVVPGGVKDGMFHRRWEFMRQQHESREELETEATAWRLLERWVRRDQANLIRHRVYTFRSLLANRWRGRRIPLAGDAAQHRMVSWCALPTPRGRTGTASTTPTTRRAWHSAPNSPPAFPSSTAPPQSLHPASAGWGLFLWELGKRPSLPGDVGGRHPQEAAAISVWGWRPHRSLPFQLKVRVHRPILESLLADIVSAQPSTPPIAGGLKSSLRWRRGRYPPLDTRFSWLAVRFGDRLRSGLPAQRPACRMRVIGIGSSDARAPASRHELARVRKSHGPSTRHTARCRHRAASPFRAKHTRTGTLFPVWGWVFPLPEGEHHVRIDRNPIRRTHLRAAGRYRPRPPAHCAEAAPGRPAASPALSFGTGG